MSLKTINSSISSLVAVNDNQIVSTDESLQSEESIIASELVDEALMQN